VIGGAHRAEYNALDHSSHRPSRDPGVSLVMSILVAAVSGVIVALVTIRLTATKEHVFFMRQKVEALYLAIKSYQGIDKSIYRLLPHNEE
jgi:hypothetical protein